MIYLDNAATTFPKPERVYHEMDAFARTSAGNPGRSGHRFSTGAERALERCRHLLNQLLDGAGAERFVFTLNGTDALNLAIKGSLKAGDHVVTGVMEHNSVLRPLQRLARDGVIELTIVGCDRQGRYDPDDVAQALRSSTRLVVATYASNAVGTLQPIAAIGDICHQHGVRFLVDAAQAAGVLPIRLRESAIDLLATPGHKALFGPMGTGVLYVAPGIELRPWREGGTGGSSLEAYQPREMPTALEAGTPNVIGVVGLAAGVAFLLEQGIEQVHARDLALTTRLRQGLAALPGVELFGPEIPDEAAALVSFRAAGWPPAELAAVLDDAFSIAVRAGLHCAPKAHEALGTLPEGLVRVSPCCLMEDAAIEAFLEAMGSILTSG